MSAHAWFGNLWLAGALRPPWALHPSTLYNESKHTNSFPCLPRQGQWIVCVCGVMKELGTFCFSHGSNLILISMDWNRIFLLHHHHGRPNASTKKESKNEPWCSWSWVNNRSSKSQNASMLGVPTYWWRRRHWNLSLFTIFKLSVKCLRASPHQ